MKPRYCQRMSATSAPPPDLDRDPDWPEHVDVVLVAGDHDDLGRLVELGHVMDAVFDGAVAAHVVDDAAAGHDEAVARLLDALHVSEGGVPVHRSVVDAHLHHTPPARADRGRERRAARRSRRALAPGPLEPYPPGGVWATGMSSMVGRRSGASTGSAVMSG